MVLSAGVRVLTRKAIVRFVRAEDGAFVAFALFMILFILVATGLGVDSMRTELIRTHLQQTADRAVLAAADLEQDLTAKDVIKDYFAREGIPTDALQIVTSQSDSEREAGVTIKGEVSTLLLDLVGFESLPAPAGSVAIEGIRGVEVSLILDNSGSMGWNNDYRLNLLKPAAQGFVDDVLQTDGTGPQADIFISLVPFSTQVNAGPLLDAELNLSDEHAMSACVDFETADFQETKVMPTDALRRVGHFDAFTYNTPVQDRGLVCQTEDSRHILPWSQNADDLKAQIDNMYAYGNTSIDIAAKWGAALLDPAFSGVLSSLADDGHVDDMFRGQPFAYDSGDTMKVLVVMSDGQNTRQYRLAEDFRTGASPLWQDPDTDVLSYFDDGSYFVFDNADLDLITGGEWLTVPAGGASATNLSWQEVWELMSVSRFARDIKAVALGGSETTYRDEIRKSTAPSPKNNRLSNICGAAKAQGVIVYTVGMDTYGEGDASLSDCATSPAYFYDVNSEEIDDAFASIARQISALRLTQ